MLRISSLMLMIKKVYLCTIFYTISYCTLFNKINVTLIVGELVSNRPVPFRLTPNFVELMTDIGKNGPLTASIMATARCFNQPNNKIQAILRAILRDEMITSYKKVLKKNFY